MKTDVSKALEIINNQFDFLTYAEYCYLYSFTTENIKGYYSQFDFNDKKVLTVAASGDHLLNAVLLGTKDITTFDINRLSYYFQELKIGALKGLELKDFKDYFLLRNEDESLNNNAFSYDKFKSLEEFFSEDVFRFWAELYRKFNYNGVELRRSSLFNNKHDTYENKTGYNLYLNRGNYETLQGKIQLIKRNFICSSLVELPSALTDRYDLMFLSNISDYIKDCFAGNYLKEYTKFIETDLCNYLNPNGEIAMAYIYDFDKNKEEGRTDIDIGRLREKVLEKSKFREIIFESAISKNKKDGIIVYKGGESYGK